MAFNASKGVIKIGNAGSGEEEYRAWREIPSKDQEDWAIEFNTVPYSGEWATEETALPPYSASEWYGTSVFDNYVPLLPNQRRLLKAATKAYETVMGNGRTFAENRDNPEFIKKVSTMADQFGYKVYITSFRGGWWEKYHNNLVMKLVVEGHEITVDRGAEVYVSPGNCVVVESDLRVHISANMRPLKRKNLPDKSSPPAKRRLNLADSETESCSTDPADFSSDNNEDPPPTYPPFRTIKGMWMIEVGDGDATWLYSPKETKEYFDALSDDESTEAWALSDYLVADTDYKKSVVADQPPPLCTHYVESTKTGMIGAVRALPWGYFEYAKDRTKYFYSKLNDVYRNSLNRGNTQSTFAELKSLVKDDTKVTPHHFENGETCTVCNTAGRRATFKFGPFNVGAVCADHLGSNGS